MLTKSDYIKHLQCQKYLWLYKNRKELLLEDVDDDLERAFATGYAIEELAYKLYPGGVDVGEGDFKEVIIKTKSLMEDKTNVIFQPSVSSDELFCRADIIRYNKTKDAWDIIEVKSATEVKDIYIDDLSFQKICFEEAGFKVANIFLAYVNNQYVKDGNINPHELIAVEDITSLVSEREGDAKLEIKKALEVLKIKEEPEMQVLRQCNNPYSCPFIDYCWKDFSKHSIYSIAGALGEKKLIGLLDEGIMEIKDIPPEYLTNEKLRKHHHVVKHNVIHLEKDNIKKELENIEYPIYFLDYETYAPAIPIIDGYRPYQRIVFQYSLHVQESPGSELKHYYFLAKDLKDPSEAMSKTLQERIGKTGSIVAWNMGFEKGCNTEMGERVPGYEKFYEDVNERIYDLMHVFKKGYYVHKDFHGSASLKKVLPVVAPELSYGDLGISEGMTASYSWGDMVSKEMSQKDKDKIYSNLLDYCELDTFAMVRILEELNKL